MQDSRCHACIHLVSALVVSQEFDIDTEKLPLGQLSKQQVQRGYDVLERLRTAISGGGESLERLSSEFYQVYLKPVMYERQCLRTELCTTCEEELSC